ncbi:GntR family transcriptional regulator [Mycobacterium antarcticum]|uniref:GntR family transcriptional regulator n=1 Tax=unclassified Mycolicibacterium TaxID=2636767 RepID=UPI00238D027D|nr:MULTISPECIES: GntR family transcriptional regulator [unclassified Mycolicibacterium]BDX31503.1 GntR family transcriptional regulator [Mycolicibacterium sp. TUM20985]GLP74850.1 GntR family transcriptional regulator [Mycolicibacterium sp. TUM20983]GLP80650.1 GntR family transcriptional regulator [Mycolicibacterium sp. TUM20984]
MPGDPSPSLSRLVYSTVRERIILGQYPQGSRLPEQRIGEELHVSRVPLREAVPWLERDGFVHSRPRRGAVVAHWDAKAIDDLFDVRLSLEVGAARYAARQVSFGGPMDTLDAALAEAQQTVAGGDAYAIAKTSTAFHEAVIDTAGNELMVRLMRTISGRITWLFFLTSGLPADEAFHDHVLLRDAIASGNERVAESVAYAHIERDRQPTFDAMAGRLG